jgi:hypothetical protein
MLDMGYGIWDMGYGIWESSNSSPPYQGGIKGGVLILDVWLRILDIY